MRYGIREICDVVLKKKTGGYFGKLYLDKDMPVMYFDTMKTSSLEGQSTSVYAQGGKGNPRLVAWEGDRTVTFTMEDALISPESFSILSGAGFMSANSKEKVFIHTTEEVQVKNGMLELAHVPAKTGSLYIMLKNADGSINTNRVPMEIPLEVEGASDPDTDPDYLNKNIITVAGAFAAWRDNYNLAHADLIRAGKIMEAVAPVATPYQTILDNYKNAQNPTEIFDYVDGTNINNPGSIMYVDYYVQSSQYVKQIDIEADKFGGSYYLEASTLFRDQASGEDYPAEFIIPNCKIQSNFTFTMAPTGDPSTFTFTMDAFPDYTKFDKTKKVLAALQIVEDKELYADRDNELIHLDSAESDDSRVYEDSGKKPPKKEFPEDNG